MTRRRTVVTLGAFVLALAFGLTAPASAQQEAAIPSKTDDPPPAETAPLATQPATQPAEKPNPQAAPRSMVQEFLRAVGESDEKPERISDAVKCLDLSQLEREDPEKAKQQAPLLARQLAQVIDDLLNTYGQSLEDIPEHTEETIISFPKEGTKPAKLQRYDDGLWRFSAETVAAIPDYVDATKEAAKESESVAVKIDPTIPREYRSARATMKTYLDAMKVNSAVAGKCLDLQDRSAATRTEIGQDLADRLLFVMDRIKLVVLQEIPDGPDGDPYTWYFSEHGRIEIAPEPPGAEREGQWLFTTGTVKSIPLLYKAFEDKPRLAELDAISFSENPRQWLLEKVPRRWKTEFLALQLWQWTGISFLLIVGYLLDRISFSILCAIARPIGRSDHIRLPEDRVTAAMRPLGIIIMVAAWWFGLRLLLIPPAIQTYVWPALKFVMTAVTAWGSYRLIDLACDYFAATARRSFNRLDDVLVPLLRKTAKIVVVVIGAIFILRALGVGETTVNKMFAGLGLGGLAFALAAQDTLKNFFGSIAVVLDRPFQVGDWVKIGSVEGTVETVGLRSSRIRSFYNSQITVPNSEILNATVDNMGRRRFRRIRCMISVTYSTTPEQLDAFCEGIRELIRQLPYMRKDYFHAYVNEFAGSSIDILLYCFLETPDWPTELRERHRLFLDIIRVAKRLGVEFAFPTQTVHLHHESSPGETASPRPALPANEDDSMAFGREVAATVVRETLGEDPKKPPPVKF